MMSMQSLELCIWQALNNVLQTTGSALIGMSMTKSYASCSRPLRPRTSTMAL
uniref:Uncharacterized protein n=1 Tax=Arundo donax TaxID=35708 RepID=A0A0A8Y5F5_ARUDO